MMSLIFIGVLAVLAVGAAWRFSVKEKPREMTLLDPETGGLCDALERTAKK